MTFTDILRAFKVIPMIRSGGASNRPTTPDTGGGGGYGSKVGGGAGGGGSPLRSAVGSEFEWRLSPIEDAQRRRFLVDDETKVGGLMVWLLLHWGTHLLYT